MRQTDDGRAIVGGLPVNYYTFADGGMMEIPMYTYAHNAYDAAGSFATDLQYNVINRDGSINEIETQQRRNLGQLKRPEETQATETVEV